MGCSQSTHQINFIYGLKEAYHLVYEVGANFKISSVQEIVSNSKFHQRWANTNVKIEKYSKFLLTSHFVKENRIFRFFADVIIFWNFFSFNIKGIFDLHLWLKFEDFSSSQ